jgi:hypothetical protein
VIRRVGKAAYELELSKGSRIHNVFHVSCLKKALGQQVVSSTNLPPLDEEGHLILVPEQMLAFREKRLRNKTVNVYLIRWKDLPEEDATWVGKQILQHSRLQLLEDKQSQGGRTVISPPL